VTHASVGAQQVNTYQGNFTWRNQAPPANDGGVRSDTNNLTGASLLSFGTHDNTGIDATNLWNALNVGDTLTVEQTSNPTGTNATYSVTSAPVQAGAQGWNIGVSYTSGVGVSPNNNADCTCTFNLTLTEDEALNHVCDEYDVQGFVDHRQPVRLFSDAQSNPNAFPDQYWCQFCHQMFVRTGEEA
jgi:hypothetical protein